MTIVLREARATHEKLGVRLHVSGERAQAVATNATEEMATAALRDVLLCSTHLCTQHRADAHLVALPRSAVRRA